MNVDVSVAFPDGDSIIPHENKLTWRTNAELLAERGDHFILSEDRVWYRVELPVGLAAGNVVSIPVFGELASLYLDDKRVDLEMVERFYLHVSLHASMIGSARYAYLEVARPHTVPNGVFQGPEFDHFDAIERYLASRQGGRLPFRFEWRVYSDKNGEGQGEASWSNDWPPRMSGDETTLAIRFDLPDDYAGPAMMVHRGWAKSVEVLIGGERYATANGRRISAAASLAASNIGPNVIVRLPRDRSGSFEIRWKFHSHALLKRTGVEQYIPSAVRFGSSDLMYRAMHLLASHNMATRAYFLGLIFISAMLFAIGFARRGPDRRAFFSLAIFLLGATGALARNWIGNIFESLPVLRALPFQAMVAVSNVFVYSVPILAVRFHRISLGNTPDRATAVANRIFRAVVLVVFLVVTIAEQLSSLLAHDLDIPSSFYASLTILAYITAIVPIAYQSRGRINRTINTLFLIFGVILVGFAAFETVADNLIDVGAFAHLWLRVAFLILCVSPLIGIPLVVFRRVEMELINANVVFRRFVPEEFLSFLGINDIAEIVPGKKVATTLTVMFCDIRSFTALAEGLEPAAVMSYINRYLEYVGPIIRRHDGFVDKYLGDGVMAIFPGGGNSARAAALEIVDGVPTVDPTIEAKAAIGLHRGSRDAWYHR